MGIALLLHVLSAVVWVGGMFFAVACLRPAAATLEPAARVQLWAETLRLFFRWVWLAVALLLATGIYMLFEVLGGLRGAGPHVHLMVALGLVMMALAAHVWFAPLRRLREALAQQHWSEAGKRLQQIRIFVTVNAVLGLVVIAVASAGRYFWREGVL